MKIWWILVISLLLRLPGLNQSLWLDEAISANVAGNYSYREIVEKFSPADFHPPGYYWTLKGWTTVFGTSEIGLRSLSVASSLVTIYIIYLIGGVWPAILTGLNPLLLYYSQEARMYSLVTMWLILALYFFKNKKWLGFNLMAFLSFMTFYGSVFLLAAMALYLLIYKKYKEFLIANIGLLIAILILLPLIIIQKNNSAEMLFTVKNWSLVLGQVNLKNLLLIPIKFTSGRISFYPKFIYYLIAGSFALVVWRRLFLKNIYGFIFWSTLFIGTVFSIFTPMMQYFRFLYLVPVMCLLIYKNKLIAGGFLIFSLVYISNSNFYREDWKSMVTTLPEKVYMIKSFEDPVKYYDSKITVNDIRAAISENQITVIPYGEAIHGVDHRKILTEAGYKKVSTVNFREVYKEDWSR